MQAVGRYGLRAVRAIKPTFSGRKVTDIGLRNVAALHTSRRYLLVDLQAVSLSGISFHCQCYLNVTLDRTVISVGR